MKNLRSFCLTFILLFASEYYLFAQQIEPVPHSSDSLIIFLNRVESVKAIKGEIGYLPKNELEKINNLHLTGAISGKISGVDTRSVSNGNMNSLIFNMRGTKNPFLNKQPIYVVDGIPITAVIPSAIGIDMGDLINDWCLDDIESISILKSGEAAALYGNRAGNGVIVIKTRKAEKAGFHVDFSSSIQLRKIGDSPDFQNKYGQGYNGEFSYVDGSGGGINEWDGSWGPPLDGRLIPQFDGPATGWVNDQSVTVRGGDIYARDDAAMHGIDNSITPTPWIAHPDNVKNFFETSSAFANHIGLSWALKKAGVRFSYRNVRADDILPGNSRYAAHTLGGSLNYAITKSLSVFYTFNYNKTKDEKLYVTGTYNSYNPMYYFAWMSRQVNSESMKNYWQAGKQNIEQYSYQYLYGDNPWLISNENSTEITRKNLFGSFGFTLKPLKGFTINYLGGINLVNSESNQKLYSVPLGAIHWKTGNESNELNTSNHTFYADYKLSVSRKNELSSFVSAYTAKSYFHNYYHYETSYSGETTVDSKSRGFSGGLNYERNSMLSFRLALSKDRYNDFSTIRSPLFYSLSFNAELNKILHFPELISTCTVQSGVSSSGLNTIPIINGSTSTINNKQPFETVFEYNAAFIFGILNNRLLLQANFYNGKTKNGIMPQIMPPTYIIFTQGAVIKSSGMELSLKAIPLSNSTFNWETELVYFKNTNKTIALIDGIISLRRFETGNVLSWIEANEKIGNLYGSKYERYEGKIIFVNGIPKRSSGTQLLGNVNPDYVMFLNNSVAFRQFEFGLGFEFSKGGLIYSSFYRDATLAGNMQQTANRETEIIGDGVKWDETRSFYVKNDVSVSAEGYYGATYHLSEYSLMDATFLKLKQLNVAYRFTIAQKVKMKSSIFCQDIFLFSKCKDYNNNAMYHSGNTYYRGINEYNLPETYIIGLKVQFEI